MAKIYADLVEKGLRTFEQIPAPIRKAVEEELRSRGEEKLFRTNA